LFCIRENERFHGYKSDKGEFRGKKEELRPETKEAGCRIMLKLECQIIQKMIPCLFQ
jgi:hypothetical protein